MLIHKGKFLLAGVMLVVTGGAFAATDADTQGQIDAIKAAIPKFAVPMREVGDRFQNMYFAAKGGNWALAAYMGKYLNGAMNPAKLTKPTEYVTWQKFYSDKFSALNAAVMAKDLPAFVSAYAKVTADCNGCHKKMEYGFIKLVMQPAPSDVGIDYSIKSEPGDVPQ